MNGDCSGVGETWEWPSPVEPNQISECQSAAEHARMSTCAEANDREHDVGIDVGN